MNDELETDFKRSLFKGTNLGRYLETKQPHYLVAFVFTLLGYGFVLAGMLTLWLVDNSAFNKPRALFIFFGLSALFFSFSMFKTYRYRQGITCLLLGSLTLFFGYVV